MTVTGREDAPYANATERLLDEFARIDLLLRRHLESWWAEREGQVNEFRGLYVSDEEVDRLLATGRRSEGEKMPRGNAGIGRTAGTGRTGGDVSADACARLTARIEKRAARTAEIGGPCRLGTLVERFGLDRWELDVLLLAFAPDFDEKYEKVYGYLQDDVTRTRPGTGLVQRVLAPSQRERFRTRDRFEPGSTLVEEGLVVLDDGRPFGSRPVRVPARVASYLVGGDTLHGRLADDAAVVEPARSLSSLSLEDECRASVERVLDRLAADGDPLLVAFVGPDETTAERAVEATCAETDRPMIRVDAAALADDDRRRTVAQLRREVRLRDAAIHVRNLGALDVDHTRAVEADEPRTNRSVDETPIESLVLALDAIPGAVFVTGDVPLTERLEPRLSAHGVAIVDFPRPGPARRVALWSAVADLPDDVAPETLAATYRLTAGQIEDAVATARAMGDGTLTAATIQAGCRAHARHRLDELAREVEPGYDWDDIVLPPDTRAHLEEVAAHVRYRGTVFEEWGFEDRFSRGNGINVLFTGSSGTGKTMAVEVVARETGLPLYVIDLSAVTSKYIGETEKNLRRIFDEAEHSNAILFFDEADAVFGKRTDVSDAHDRYANVEVDYLLQRMETHDGTVVLASNLEGNIDDAFRRRINLSVHFPFPDRETRAAIWCAVFPAETPVEDVDVAFLADFELAGGNIRNVATTAAFMAAADGDPVSMAHVVRALRRELQKTDRLFEPSDFGAYAEHLPRYDDDP